MAAMKAWHLAVLCLLLVPVLARGAEPTAHRPVIYHAFSQSDAHPRGPFGGALATLAAVFEIRPLPPNPDPSSLEPTASVWLLDRASTPSSDATAWLRWVSLGGGLVLMNSPSRTAPPAGTPDLPRDLLRKLEILRTARPTAAKRLRIPDTHPFLAGLTWSTDGFALIDVPDAPNLRGPILLPNVPGVGLLVPGTPDFAGYAMIAGDFGKGRLAVLADDGWTKDLLVQAGKPPTENTRDHPELLSRLFRWIARAPLSATHPSPSQP